MANQRPSVSVVPPPKILSIPTRLEPAAGPSFAEV